MSAVEWYCLKIETVSCLSLKNRQTGKKFHRVIYKQVEEKVETSVNLGRDPVQSLTLMESSLLWIFTEGRFPN